MGLGYYTKEDMRNEAERVIIEEINLSNLICLKTSEVMGLVKAYYSLANGEKISNKKLANTLKPIQYSIGWNNSFRQFIASYAD